MWTYLGVIIREGRGWTGVNGVKHPPQWTRWTDQEKTARGLVWDQSLQPVPFDNRFYRSAGNPKDVGDLKTDAIAQVKVAAANLLQSTDWMVTRKAEAGTAIPDSVGNYRTAVRTASGTIETAITNAADHAAFMALYDTPVDSDGNSTGNAPINDWPDEI